MFSSLTDTLKLSSGYEIPCVGFGTYLTPDGDTCVNSVKAALAAGYRHIDTAEFYMNEDGVGRGIARSGVPRGDIFVTTKVWNTHQGYDSTLAAFDASLKSWGLTTSTSTSCTGPSQRTLPTTTAKGSSPPGVPWKGLWTRDWCAQSECAIHCGTTWKRFSGSATFPPPSTRLNSTSALPTPTSSRRRNFRRRTEWWWRRGHRCAAEGRSATQC